MFSQDFKNVHNTFIFVFCAIVYFVFVYGLADNGKNVTRLKLFPDPNFSVFLYIYIYMETVGNIFAGVIQI